MNAVRWLLVLSTLLVLNAQASWTLDNQQSAFYFTFTKNTHLATTATFEQLKGDISDNGEASLYIDLASLESGIVKRDNRLRDLFFRVADFPMAEVSVRLSNRIKKKFVRGKTAPIKVSAKVIMNGKQVRMRPELSVYEHENGDIEVSSVQPVLMDAFAFGYAEQVQTMIDLAGVNNISKTVMVNFRLYYHQDRKVADASAGEVTERPDS